MSNELSNITNELNNSKECLNKLKKNNKEFFTYFNNHYDNLYHEFTILTQNANSSKITKFLDKTKVFNEILNNFYIILSQLDDLEEFEEFKIKDIRNNLTMLCKNINITDLNNLSKINNTLKQIINNDILNLNETKSTNIFETFKNYFYNFSCNFKLNEIFDLSTPTIDFDNPNDKYLRIKVIFLFASIFTYAFVFPLIIGLPNKVPSRLIYGICCLVLGIFGAFLVSFFINFINFKIKLMIRDLIIMFLCIAIISGYL